VISLTAAEGPHQLDDLLRVPPGFAGAGPVAEPVQRLADLGVRGVEIQAWRLEKPTLRSVANRMKSEARSAAKRNGTMQLSQAEQEIRDRCLKVMLEATFTLQTGSDQEMTLQALIRAADLLKERFEQELVELRQESD
jgi:hypothetical protein